MISPATEVLARSLRGARWLWLSLWFACESGASEPQVDAARASGPHDAGQRDGSQTLRDGSQARADAARSEDASQAAHAPETGVSDTTANSDAGPGADPLGASRCDSAAVALCDDFESEAADGVPSTATWRVLTSYSGQPSTVNRVAIDTQHAARGKRAVHVHTETNDPVYLETNVLPSMNNGFYGRVFAYFGQDPGARSKGHWGAFVGVGKKSADGQDIEVRIGGQFDILVANYAPNDALQTSASRDGYYDDGARLPIATWSCFEFQFDGAGQQLRVWLDGAELERLHVTDWNQFGHGLTPAWSPAYDRVRIGYQSWNADTPIDVWYDAVALDPERIGCEK